MHRARASLPPDAIRIEDEVWQEAFRETTRPRSRARLRSLDGGRVAARPGARTPAAARRVSGPAPRRAETAPTPRVPDPTPRPATRRTVTITGRGAERNLWATETARRRPARLPHERAGFKPDRVAMWAVFLGMLLLLVAALSAHA